MKRIYFVLKMSTNASTDVMQKVFWSAIDRQVDLTEGREHREPKRVVFLIFDL